MCKQAYRDLAIDLSMELFQEGIEKGYTTEILAEKIGASPHSIHDYRYGRTSPSLAVFIGGWLTIKPEKVLKKLASWSGYSVFKLPEIDTHSFPILSKKTAASLQEFSEFIDSIGNAALDSKITKAEAEKIRKEGIEAIEKILETIHTAERLAR